MTPTCPFAQQLHIPDVGIILIILIQDLGPTAGGHRLHYNCWFLGNKSGANQCVAFAGHPGGGNSVLVSIQHAVKEVVLLGFGGVEGGAATLAAAGVGTFLFASEQEG